MSGSRGAAGAVRRRRSARGGLRRGRRPPARLPGVPQKVSCERAVREALIARRDGSGRMRRPTCGAAAPRRMRRADGVGGEPARRRRPPAPGAGCRSRWRRRSCSRSPACSSTAFAAAAKALAAQLVADHVKCFEFAPQPTVIPDGRALGREWAATRGWNLKVPENADAEQLTLLDVRRCISSDGRHGAPDLQVARSAAVGLRDEPGRTRASGRSRSWSRGLGRKRFMWTKDDRTYAVVAARAAGGRRTRRPLRPDRG